MSRCYSPVEMAGCGRGDDDARLTAHLAECADCRLVFGRVSAAQMALVDARELSVPEASEVRAEATLRWMRVPPAPAPRRRLAWLGLGLGVSCAVAAGVFLVPRLTHKPVVATVVVPAPATVAAPVAATLQALVTLRAGRVERERAGVRSLFTAAVVDEGDVLVTPAGGVLAAQWGDASGLLLRSGSELGLTTLRAGQQMFDLPSGRVDIRVKHEARAPSLPPVLTVRTPGHLVHARGTWFAVWAEPTQTTVEVYEGTVEVTERDGASSTLLHAPSRGVFGRDKHAGRARTEPMTVAEAAKVRQHSELNLLAFGDLPSLLKDSGTLSVEGLGSLELKAKDVVAVDGVALGPSPLWLRGENGRHLVELSRKGFEPVRRWVTIGAEPGELRLSPVRLARNVAEAEVAVPDVSVIDEMLRQRRSQIRSCYERSLKRDPQLAGTVTLRLVLDNAGRVASSAVDSETLTDPAVGRCLRNEAAGWAFPGGRNATIVYPFVFRPQ